jgi:hypothetical protein
MTITSSDVDATISEKEHKTANTETRNERFEINRHRDGAVFKVRYREGSIAKRCLLDQPLLGQP